MKLTTAQFCMLGDVCQWGPHHVVEVVSPPSMDGKQKRRLERNALGSIATLSKLEALGFLAVVRSEIPQDRHRRRLIVSITDAGREWWVMNSIA